MNRLEHFLRTLDGSVVKALVFAGLMVLVMPIARASEYDLDNYKFRTTASWWYSQPSGYFAGQNHSGEFDLNRDFHFGSYSTFTGTLDWRFKRKHHLLFSSSPVSYSNRTTLLRTITFQGQTYNVGTQAASEIKSLSFAPGYQWDFIRRDRGYVALATQF